MKILKNLLYKKYNHLLILDTPNGLHLRPVAKFVSIAKEYECDIYLEFDGKIKDAKNINSILELEASYKDKLTLHTQGKNAKNALDELSKAFEKIIKEDAKKAVDNTPSKTTQTVYTTKSISLTPIYQGITIAPVFNLKVTTQQNNTNLSIQEAIALSIKKLETKDEDIFEAQKELLNSIDQEIDTLQKLQEYIDTQIAKLPANLKSKAIDYQDIQNSILSHMGITQKLILPSHPSILVCDDLLPSQIKEITSSPNVAGVILQKASLSSHSAILLRSYGIVSAIYDKPLQDETLVILDTLSHTLVLNPSQDDINTANSSLKSLQNRQQQALQDRNNQAITKQGKCITVLANISDHNSALQAKEMGAEGVGLLRSEFMFTSHLPSLQEQVDIYTKIFTLFDNITVRTLDVGGDKNLPYIDIPKEENPFLGIRGIRLLDVVPQLISTQLLAIYKASNNKPIKIMFPMVSTTDEFIKAKEFALQVAKDNNIDISHILFGMMIETPLVVFNLDKFDKLVDFYSIGSNDLAQYSFAIQRGHPSLVCDETNPEFLNLISYIIKHANKPLSICGEMASNPKVLKQLISMGCDTISLSPSTIPTIKEEIRDV